jgi:hypothetical protein
LENIQVFLKRYSSKNALFFHNFDVFPRNAAHIPDVEDKDHFPISIMSRKAVELLSTKGYAKCILGYKHVPSIETILVHCLEDMGVSVISEEGLHPTEPTHDFNWPGDACKRPLAISRLDANQMTYLFRSRPTTGMINGVPYKWDTIVTYADIFHHTFATKAPTPNIDRHTASSVSKRAISGMECMTLCESNKNCVSWTFEGETSTCYLSPTAGVAIPRERVISGLITSRYNCNTFISS